MTAPLVSLEDAKARLKVDGTATDAILLGCIKAASAAVLRYIRPSDPSFLDSYGDPEEDSAGDAINIPEDVQTATLMLAGIFLRDPDGKDSDKWEHGFLPTPVLSILYPFRLPTLA